MAYFDKYGVRYSDDKKTLEWCPEKFEGEYIIPNDVISIEFGAFSSCIGLKSIMIPNTVKKIGEQAFYNCTSLTKIDLPNSIIEIGESAFEGCSGLTSIDIPNSVTRIGKCAFEGCTALTSLEIPNSVTSIGEETFYNCSSLTTINVSNDNPNYIAKDGGLFNKQLTTLIQYPARKQGAYAIPNSVTSIGDEAFSGCSGLTSVTIPNSVTSIGDDAFSNCTGLTSVDIPNSVTNIGNLAFSNCTGLTSVTIPNSVTNIGVCAFQLCKSLTSIEIPNSVTSIGNYAFFGCRGLTSVTIPNSVTSIGDWAFNGCRGLTSVTIPNSVTSIGERAFDDCSGLTSIEIPESVTAIGYGAFGGCRNLRSIIVPQGQKTHFLQMGLKEYEDIIVERDNEELTILLNLAKAYELGIGVAKNMAQSVLYYTQAAEKGSAEAAYRLAEWYQNGEVLPLDLNKALDLYQQAAKSGYKDAEEKAQRIQQKIEAEEKKQADYLAEKQKEQETKAVVEAQAKPYYLFFDTETAGLPPKGKYDVPVTNPDFWPRLVQLAWILTDKEGRVLNRKSKIIYPNGFSIPTSATAIHHITTEHAMQVGEPLRDVLGEFMRDLLKAEKIVCHNVEFDQHIVGAELYSMDMEYKALMNKTSICTKLVSTNFCALPNTNGHSGYKWPSLPELYQILFGRDFENAHDALADITATKECFFELKRRGIIKE